MSLILSISILICLVAVGLSIVSLRQIKDWRMGYLSIMLGLLAISQILRFWETWETNEFGTLEIIGHAAELPGLIVSIMALLGIFCLKNMLNSDRKKAEERINRFSHIFENSLNEIYQFNANTLKFEQVNHAAQKNLGYTMDELLKMTPVDIKPDFTLKPFKEMITPLRKGEKEMLAFETIHERKNKSLYDVEVHLQFMRYGHEELFTAIIMDISERKQAEKALRNSEERFRALYEENPHMLFTLDKNGRVLSVNQFGIEQLGYSREQLTGEPIINVFYEEDRNLARKYLQQCFANPDKVHSWELRKVRQDGSLFWVRETARVLIDEKDTSKILIVCEDITATRRLSEQLSFQASHDTLTGLANRREFELRAGRLLSTVSQNDDEHALCFMDLDQFKVVNDTCGHTAGDQLLRQLSSVLTNAVRHRDTLARLGGDEFGVLMEHCSLDDAHRVALSLQKAVQDHQYSWEGRRLKVGVSIGLVPITIDTTNLTELMKQADSACNLAKDKGRNRIHIYHEGDRELAQRHGEMQWVERINRALEEDKFCLYAQPIASLNGGSDNHYELLIRMLDEQGNSILPGAFLPAAERYNLISKIDHWVIKNAFGLLAENSAFLEHINFCSINVSGQSITDKDFLGFITTQLDESGIPGKKICFEITETAAISNLSIPRNFISTLKGLRCWFALDDFGSGLSSFGYLKNLPVDHLKIDGMFVKNIVNSPIDHAMVRSINEIGHVLGMQTIAEFVENDTIKSMLIDIGVNYGQGYGIGQPQPFNELLGKLNDINELETCTA